MQDTFSARASDADGLTHSPHYQHAEQGHEGERSRQHDTIQTHAGEAQGQFMPLPSLNLPPHIGVCVCCVCVGVGVGVGVGEGVGVGVGVGMCMCGCGCV